MKTPKLIAIFLAIFAVTAFAAAQQKSTTKPPPKPAAGKSTTQSKKAAPQIDNWISGELGLFGIGLRYERMMGPEFSIGAETYWNSTFFVWNDGGIIVFGRYYLGQFLFAEGGVGYNYHTGIGDYEWKSGGQTYTLNNQWISTSGFVISPGLGWKIDSGEPGGFFVQPGIKIPVTIGTKKPVVLDIIGWSDDNSQFGVSFGVILYCGLGYAF
jgi:hypothetical protein